ncbi:hypothetical protein VP01_962g1 [Puccinia sorghi]|uniref:Uncharacterized protein n=1 Tax=Puccinia sorghi TaxID=27349 RepID=A0A0L6U651_9BASI|nr:hypothetical protein VP01_962g1 [Puccinia sorghi]
MTGPKGVLMNSLPPRYYPRYATPTRSTQCNGHARKSQARARNRSGEKTRVTGVMSVQVLFNSMHILMVSMSRKIKGQSLKLGAMMTEVKMMRESLDRLLNSMEACYGQGLRIWDTPGKSQRGATSAAVVKYGCRFNECLQFLSYANNLCNLPLVTLNVSVTDINRYANSANSTMQKQTRDLVFFFFLKNYCIWLKKANTPNSEYHQVQRLNCFTFLIYERGGFQSMILISFKPNKVKPNFEDHLRPTKNTHFRRSAIQFNCRYLTKPFFSSLCFLSEIKFWSSLLHPIPDDVLVHFINFIRPSRQVLFTSILIICVYLFQYQFRHFKKFIHRGLQLHMMGYLVDPGLTWVTQRAGLAGKHMSSKRNPRSKGEARGMNETRGSRKHS